MYLSIFADWLNKYEAYLSPLKDSTRKIYHSYLKMIDNAVLEVNPSSISLDVKEIDMVQERMCQNVSRSTYISRSIFLDKFIRFLSYDGIYVTPPVIPVMQKTYYPHLFTDEDIKKIIYDADISAGNDSRKRKNNLFSFEYPIILRLLAYYGMRCGEVCAIRLCDIDFEKKIIVLKKTKMNRERIVPLKDDMFIILLGYITKMQIPLLNGYLFPSNNGCVKVSDVYSRFKKTRILYSFDDPNRKRFERGACIHCLRHYFAVSAYTRLAEQEEVDMATSTPYLSIFMGHTSIRETDKYISFIDDTKIKAVEFMEEMVFSKLSYTNIEGDLNETD